MKCPMCQAENADDALFCANCGAQMMQAAPVEAEPAPVAAQPADAQSGGWKKIVLLVGSICGLVAVAFSFIFTFLIGLSGAGETFDIGYVFGDAWKDMLNFVEGMADSQSVNMSALFVLMIRSSFGSLIYVGFIIAMLVLLIKCIIRYVKCFKGTLPEGKGVEKLTTGTYCLYALGAALISSMIAQSASTMGATISLSYNGATLAGLIIGGICLAAFIASRVAVQGKELIKPAVLVPAILTVVFVVFVAVVWGVAAGPIVAASGEGISMGMSFVEAIGASNLVVSEGFEPSKSQLMTFVYSYLGWVMVCVLLSLCCAMVVVGMRNLMRKEQNFKLGLPIATFIFSLFVMIFAILAAGEIAEILGGGVTGFSSSVVAPVFVFLMGLFSLAIVITQKVLASKAKKQAAAQYNAPQA